MKQFLSVVALSLVGSMPLMGGVVYEIEVTDHEQSPPKTESIQAAVEGRHLKMGIASHGDGSKGEMIFRGDRREFVVVDHDSRSYHLVDAETIQRIGGAVSGALSEAERMMQEALKNVPEDKRAMVEQMMKQKMPAGVAGGGGTPSRPSSQLVKTSETGTRNGYPCVKYEVVREGRKTRELWVTDWDNVEGGSEVADSFGDMSDFFRELLDSIPQFGGGETGFDNNIFEHMKEIEGFPVLTRDFADDGGLEGETALRSSRRQTIDPDAFEPPSGYKRQEMFDPR